jgi:hypothetical protein
MDLLAKEHLAEFLSGITLYYKDEAGEYWTVSAYVDSDGDITIVKD